MSLFLSLEQRYAPSPLLSALIDNNADVRLRENDPKYGDDSRRAIMSRFYQTATVSDVRMANGDRTETNLAFFSAALLLVEITTTKIHP